LERKRGTAMKGTVGVSVLILGALLIVGADAFAGQFKTAVYYGAGQRPYQVAAAHLTGSGNLDLVVADYLTSQIFILLGNGDGTFQPPLKFSIYAPVALAVGDFNDDHVPDLAVVKYGGTGESHVPSCWEMVLGSFASRGSILRGWKPRVWRWPTSMVMGISMLL
jgi:hypothetical protein